VKTLCERATVLRYTYTANLVNCTCIYLWWKEFFVKYFSDLEVNNYLSPHPHHFIN